MIEPSFLFGQFLGGLTTAMFLFLIASGLSLVFGVMRVLNFAHGSFYMLGAYLAWQVVQWLGPAPHALLARGARRGARRGAARRGRRAAAAALALRARGALPAAAHLRAGADPGRCRQGDLGHPAALGVATAGACRRLRGVRHHAAGLQSVHHAGRAGDRGRRLARAHAQQRRAHGAGGGARPRDAGRARRQCRRDLYRHVRRQLVSRRPVRRAGDADPEHRARAWTSRSSSRRSSSW